MRTVGGLFPLKSKEEKTSRENNFSDQKTTERTETSGGFLGPGNRALTVDLGQSVVVGLEGRLQQHREKCGGRKQVNSSLSCKLMFHMLCHQGKERVKMVTEKNPGSKLFF